MLFSLSLILIMGFTLSELLEKIHLPGLLGMILTGIILGPYTLDLISIEILEISEELRKIALVIILLRAGLALDLRDLKIIGRPAVLLSFLPALFEITAITLVAVYLFRVSWIEAAIMGTVVAAVSPAIIVPKMLKLMEGGYGKKKRVPQLIMAGASVDDVFVIILFTTFLGMYQGKGFTPLSLAAVPFSIITGLGLGILCGTLLVWFFKNIHIRDTLKVLLILSTAFLFISLESAMEGTVPISGLLAVMALGGTILKTYEVLAKRLSGKFSKIWVGAEMFLFVLVGASVNIHYAISAGLLSALLVFSGLMLRLAGVVISLLGTNLNLKEKTFCAIAYLPKATVQAAVGAIPLYAGVASGELILTVAVTAILISAPIGAIGMDLTYQKYLEKSTEHYA
jgi:NhaP-type Na+/H+ or K+/H+ antiporter